MGRNRPRAPSHGQASNAPLTRSQLPTGDVPVETGTVRLEPDPDVSTAVTVYVNGVPSSYIDLADPGYLDFEYMQQMAAVLDLLPPGPLRVVHLGAAGCAFPRFVAHTRPGSRQLAVDVDATLLARVRQWFALPRSPALRLRAQDAATTVQGLAQGSVDVIVRDVFAQDATPPSLTGIEFVSAVYRALRPGGLYLANCAAHPPLTDARRETASLRAGWPTSEPWSQLAAICEPGLWRGRRYANLVLAGVRTGPGAIDLSDSTLARALRTLPVPARLHTGSELAAFVGRSPAIEVPLGPS